MTETRQIVVPGEEVGTTESHAPGQNTYLEGRSIRALRLGVKSVRGDRVSVISLNGRYEPARGDMVIGTIVEMGPSNWYINIGAANDVGMHVNDVPWRVEFGETSKYLDIGETVLLKIVYVDEMKKAQVTMKDRQCRKLTGGLIWEVSPSKVPRIVGRNGSMIALVKDYTSVRIFVGQNGVVWLDGEPADVSLALEALHKIEAEAHTTGLTDRMKAWFEERRPGAAERKRASEPSEDETPVESGEEFRPRRERRERPRVERDAEADVDLEQDRRERGSGSAREPRREEGRREEGRREGGHERHHSERRAEHHGPHQGREIRREREEPRSRGEGEDASQRVRGPAPRRFEEREERGPRRETREEPGSRSEGEDASQRVRGPAPRRFEEPRSGRRREGEDEPVFVRGEERPAPRRFEEREERGPRRETREERPAPRRFEEREERPAPRRFEEREERGPRRETREERPAPRRFEERAPPRRFEEREERPARKPRFDEEEEAPRRPRIDAPPRAERPKPRPADDEEERPLRKSRFDDEIEARPARRPRFDEPSGTPRAARPAFDEDEEEEDDAPVRRDGGNGEGGKRRRRGGRGRGRGGRGERSD